MDGKSRTEREDKDSTAKEGCLIDFNKLLEGHKLYSPAHGWFIVTKIRDIKFQYPIKLLGLDDARIFTITYDGKINTKDIGPSFFTENPYAYAVEQIKKHQSVSLTTTKQNMELWTKLMKAEDKISQLQQILKAKDV